jgi:hypothetical protein
MQTYLKEKMPPYKKKIRKMGMSKIIKSFQI